MDWEKSKTYQLFTEFYNKAICPMRDIIDNGKLKEDKLLEIKDKLKLYEEVYNTMVLTIYMNSITVMGVKRFHNTMKKMGVYDNGNINLDILEDDFAEAYKEIEYLDKQYADINKGLVPVNEAYNVIKSFQEKFGTVNIE